MRKIFAFLLIISLVMLSFTTIIVAEDTLDIYTGSQYDLSQDDYVEGEIVIKMKHDKVPYKILKVPHERVEQLINLYSRNPNVEFVEPNYIARAMTNDEYYDYQWNLRDQTEGGINAEAAWSTSTGSGVIVAVLDSGVAYENFDGYTQAPDLVGTSFVQGYDFINGDAHPNDDNGHGTHVAGTIAQATDNGIGVAGVAYDATIMPVKVLDAGGSGSYTAIADGIYYAVDNGAKVINMSLGGSSGATVLENALAYAKANGVTIVAATGNDGRRRVSYPAAYDEYVIAVGATDYAKDLAYYSNYGPQVDVVAPGGDVTKDLNGDGYVDGILQMTFAENDVNAFSYYFYQGTSMATPHVAGVAALLIANGNATTPDEVQQALQDTALDLGKRGRDTTYGYGLVDAYAALQWGDAPTPPQENRAPSANDQSLSTTVDTPLNITLTGSDPDGDSLTYSAESVSIEGGTIGGSDKEVVYTPSPGFTGTDSFTFTVSDGEFSDTGTITIQVNASAGERNITYSEPDVTVTTRTRGRHYFVSAEAIVTIVEDLTNPVSGATVIGRWTGASTASVSGITGADGRVIFILDNVKTSPGTSAGFVVEEVIVDGISY